MRDWTPQEIKEISERLRRARLAAGYARATEAVRKFSWNYSRYMNYENGERPIPPKQAMLYAAAYGVSIDFIYFGKNEDFNQKKGMLGLISHSSKRIPIIALDDFLELQRIACGLKPMKAVTLPVAENEAVPQNPLFVEITDNSMCNPAEAHSFEIGDKILLDLEATPKPSEFVVAWIDEEQMAVFRRYREIERRADSVLIADLVPLNSNFRTIRVEVGLTGKIIGVCRRIYRVVNV